MSLSSNVHTDLKFSQLYLIVTSEHFQASPSYAQEILNSGVARNFIPWVPDF